MSPISASNNPRPSSNTLENRDSYPRLNAQDEKKLREALLLLADLSPEASKKRIAELNEEHASRRETVWARRGEAPLAQALAFIAKVAAAKPLPSHDGNALAEAYVAAGADTDWAAMCALAAAPRELDREAIAVALRAVYLPWVEAGAVTLQELIRIGKVKLAAPPDAEPEATTILFVDGLRMDLARELVCRLQAEGVKVSLDWMWSGFPTVTATCKPMVSPVAYMLGGPPTTSDVLPLSPDGKPTTKPVLFKLMETQGWETDSALLPDAKLWAETGRFDKEGHALGARLAERLSAGIRDAVDRILQLVRSGRSLRIVTDHGWLLMPGGLPHAALDIGLVEPNGKRTRCALVKAKAQTSYLQVPWTWNPEVSVATATGARSFFFELRVRPWRCQPAGMHPARSGRGKCRCKTHRHDLAGQVGGATSSRRRRERSRFPCRSAPRFGDQRTKLDQGWSGPGRTGAHLVPGE